ncbi:MAG TPA: Xaa-Pro peptidase family protein [Egibacteraceae bacterium]|jgi:Xaa-Pro aminopeptidase|nr:Xaa-Pro peptidase family protein [Egibacteraceae bacterium]
MTAVLRRAEAAMAAAGVNALLLGPGADLRYLTGYHALPLERLTLLVARADGRHTLVVPRLERPRAEDAGLPGDVAVADFAETDDPYRLVSAALDGSGPSPRLAVGDRLWSAFLLGLQATFPGASWTAASTVTRELRMRKTPEEVAALRRAGQAIDRVHTAVPELLRTGRTEAEVGRDIAERIVAEGHEAVNFVIVAFGPNGASPHHETGARILEEGDAVVVDIGGTLGGYCSDCTRNYVVGAAPDGYAQAHRALEEAQRAAVDAAGPGVTAAAVDAAARDTLEEAGYGRWFVHRTGHGIGLEEHEEPYIVAGNDLVLEPGMAFSIEPGVYLPGRYGMRIEDIVVVTPDGCERLNTLDRDLVRVSA